MLKMFEQNNDSIFQYEIDFTVIDCNQCSIILQSKITCTIAKRFV